MSVATETEFNTQEHGITYSLLHIYPSDPSRGVYLIPDIAHALSNLCRFGGHCREFYSVAQHSVLVSQCVPPEFERCALMHDATEAYCQDLIRAVKKKCPGYQQLENLFWKAIAANFDLPEFIPQLVKAADNRMLVTEKLVLFPNSERWEIEDQFEPYGGKIVPMTPKEAKRAFLNRAIELGFEF